jgi:heme o synthase
MKKKKENINAYPELCRIKISLFAAVSAAAGFILASSKLKGAILFLIAGIFLLACGSSALNQYQERETDALMDRTKKRVLPSGRISPVHALYFSVALIISGAAVLLATGSFAALLIGLFATLWYNGVYTYLKKKTAFAVIPGALVGALLPAIGWVAGGGDLNDPRLLAFCFFFFMWQVPHFWVFLLNHGKEYKEAGLPSLSDVFSWVQLVRITSAWIFATVVSGLFVFIYSPVQSRITFFSLLAASSWFVWHGISLKTGIGEDNAGSRAIFIKSNYYMLFIVFLLSFDRLNVLMK